MHRLIVQVMVFLHHEQERHPLPISLEELRDKVLTVLQTLDRLDQEFHSAAEAMAPLYPRANE